jgi:hypothetical protein
MLEAQLSPLKLHKEMDKVRKEQGLDITLTSHLAANYPGVSIEKIYHELDINPMTASLGNLLDRPDESTRWLVPEIFRDAIRLGFINSPIHSDFIIREEAAPQPTQIMPYWDMTMLPNTPSTLGAAESIPMGNIKFDQKTVRINKSGIGIEITDEAIQYTNISLLSIFLADVGVKLGSQLSQQAINCLINGEQADGSAAAGVVGVNTASQIAFADMVKVFTRGSLRNRKWYRCIGNEDMVNTLMNTPAFQERQTNPWGRPQLTLNTKTKTTYEIDVYTHGSVPAGNLIMADPDVTMIQLTCQPLRVESERIVQRQISGTYATITTGFAIVFADGRVILTTASNFATTPWPAFLQPLF